MRGRKPTPTMLFNLHGKPNKGRKANPEEPKPQTGDLCDAPGWMCDTQQACWKNAIEHAPAGLLAHIDRGVLAVWVVAEDLHRRAVVAQNRAASRLVQAPLASTPMQSPYLAIINKQGMMMIKAASELGFSPVSRPRIGAGVSTPPAGSERTNGARGSKPGSGLEEFLASHPDRQTKH
jgi:phage terminase small subunit